MENPNKYPRYGKRHRELAVRTRGGLVFAGKALLMLEERCPVVLFFDDMTPCFRQTFGMLSNASDTLDDLMGLELFIHQGRLGLKLIGLGYESTKIAALDPHYSHIITFPRLTHGAA